MVKEMDNGLRREKERSPTSSRPSAQPTLTHRKTKDSWVKEGTSAKMVMVKKRKKMEGK